MRGRIVRAVAAAALAAGFVATQGVAHVASADDSDGPVGYTFGQGVPTGRFTLCNFYKIDLKTGAATQVNAVGQQAPCADGLTFDDDGTLFAYRNGNTTGAGATELITVDKHNGAEHVVGPLPTVLFGGGGMTFGADGHLWLYGITLNNPACAPAGSYCLWKVNPETAASTFVGRAPTGRGVFGLAGDCEDVIAITAIAEVGPATTQARLDDVHTSSAALEKIVDLPTVGFPTGLDFDGEGELWAIGTSGSSGAGVGAIVYHIDQEDGSAGARDVTLNGAPLNSFLTGLAVSRIHCEDPETPTTAPPAPVVAAEPVFTG
jgi:hypothetical protein